VANPVLGTEKEKAIFKKLPFLFLKKALQWVVLFLSILIMPFFVIDYPIVQYLLVNRQFLKYSQPIPI